MTGKLREKETRKQTPASETRPVRTEAEQNTSHRYPSVISEIEKKLTEIEKSTNKVPRLARNSPECKMIFEKWSEKEFISILDTKTMANITYTPTDWVFKKAFPVNDRKQL